MTTIQSFAGSVGIGTTNPGTTLDIVNTTGSSNLPFLRLRNTVGGSGNRVGIALSPWSGRTGGESSQIIAEDDGSSSSRLLFYTAPSGSATTSTERMRISPAGYVGIGGISPQSMLDVAGEIRGQTALITDLGPRTATIGTFVNNGGTAGTLCVGGVVNVCPALSTAQTTTATSTHVNFMNTNGTVGSITTSGTATAYNTGSDYRLKSNIVPMSDGLEVINKLDPVYFTFNNDPSEVCSGFIAHVLQEVVPHAVSGEKDAVNPDGTNNYQGVDSSFIVSFLVSAVQELSVKNTDLEAKLQTAQNVIDLLESRMAAIEAKL